MEAQFLSTNVFALCADLVLTAKALGPVGSNYAKRSKEMQTSASSLDLLSTDACQLPFRNGFVDVVVSDLPFGQTCLSAAKLEQVLPLILSELARVLRPNSGRCVLLCGAFGPLLNAMKYTNEISEGTWKFPCKAVFPVNIGGLTAWMIQVDRGAGNPIMMEHNKTRVRKLLEKRELIARIEGGNKNTSKRRVQS